MTRKFRQAETYVTSRVMPILAKKMWGWTLKVEQPPFIEDTTKPDMMAVRTGRETIAIEAKAYDNSDTIADIRKKYMGKSLNATYVGVSHTLEVIFILRYPQEVMEATDVDKAIAHTDKLEYCIITKSGKGDFPTSGFVKGMLTDVATALSIGASPAKQIAEAADKMADGMEVAAKWLHDAIADKPAIGAVLNEILGEKVTTETCSKACLIITDAFIFQNSIAGKRVLIRQHGKLKWVFPHQLRDTDEEVHHEYADEEVLEKRRNQLPRPLSYYASPHRTVQRDSVMNDWLEILGINYAPIFADAHRIVDEAFGYDDQMSLRVLKQLWQTAYEICKSHLPQIHELAGEIFQRLIVDRKYVKSNYTLPESAALLSALVCPDIQCDKTDDVLAARKKLPKVADFACGTGALLNAVYKQVQRLFEQKSGRTSREIHAHMMENKLGGIDIYPHATHLTFMTMAGAHPDIPIGETRVVTAKCGKTDDGTYATGSLELLDNQMLFDIFEITADRVGGYNITSTKFNPSFPNNEMDIVIMNPPFLTTGADTNSSNPKGVFAAAERSDADTKEMQKALAKKDTRVSHGKLAYSYFVELADEKLRTGGRMGMILPATVLTSDPFKKIREMWATEYHDVVVITIAQKGGHDSAFSHDTNMAECMVVATKGVGENTGRAKFVCLSKRPDSLLSGQSLAVLIQRHVVTRRLEDASQGGERLMIGEESLGHMLECPVGASEWGASRVKSMSLMQIAYQLGQGKLRLSELQEGVNIPICPLGEIGQVGTSHNNIKQKGKIGAFEMHRRESNVQEGYDALWHLDNITPQRSMQVVPDYKAQSKPTHVEKAHGILRRHNSQTHYQMELRFNANSVLAHWTETPSLGVTSITNVKLEDSRYKAAWTLWTNSTLGMLCHWTTAGKQQAGRGRLVLTTLPNVPTLDVRQLSDEQLEVAEDIFADLKDARMLPYNECASDPWRHILDARLLAEVLGITDEETHRAMQRLREMLSDEPSIAGTKLEKNFCDFAKDKKNAEKLGVPYNYDDEAEAQALKAQQDALRVLDIWLP